MADNGDIWTVDSNKAVEVSLVVPSTSGQGLTTLSRFHPKFTYPIFGEQERIFGYQDLKISLRYHASDMRPNLQITYSKKFKGVGETEPTDVEAALDDFLPRVALAKRRDFEAALRQLPSDWTPPGEYVTQFEAKNGGNFEVWMGNLADPAVKQILDRIQIMVSFFIEGGTFIDDPDSLDRWEIFFLYYKKPAYSATDAPRHQFAGYSTVYKFFPLSRHPLDATVQSLDSLDFPTDPFPLTHRQSRSRISQFVILPPYQNSGNGSRLYSAIYDFCRKDPNTIEVTVEDPNEAFDDLRDVADLAFLRTTPEFQALRINTDIKIPKKGAAPRNIVDEAEQEETRRLYRIAPRQFSRVLEMHLMSKLSDSVRPIFSQSKSAAKPTEEEQHEYDLWKIFVKQRLYRHNKEDLSQMHRSERVEALTETLARVELEYIRALSLLEKRMAATDPASAGSKGKHKLEAGGDDAASASKRARVENA